MILFSFLTFLKDCRATAATTLPFFRIKNHSSLEKKSVRLYEMRVSSKADVICFAILSFSSSPKLLKVSIRLALGLKILIIIKVPPKYELFIIISFFRL